MCLPQIFAWNICLKYLLPHTDTPGICLGLILQGVLEIFACRKYLLEIFAWDICFHKQIHSWNMCFQLFSPFKACLLCLCIPTFSSRYFWRRTFLYCSPFNLLWFIQIWQMKKKTCMTKLGPQFARTSPLQCSAVHCGNKSFSTHWLMPQHNKISLLAF